MSPLWDKVAATPGMSCADTVRGGAVPPNLAFTGGSGTDSAVMDKWKMDPVHVTVTEGTKNHGT